MKLSSQKSSAKLLGISILHPFHCMETWAKDLNKERCTLLASNFLYHKTSRVQGANLLEAAPNCTCLWPWRTAIQKGKLQEGHSDFQKFTQNLSRSVSCLCLHSMFAKSLQKRVLPLVFWFNRENRGQGMPMTAKSDCRVSLDEWSTMTLEHSGENLSLGHSTVSSAKGRCSDRAHTGKRGSRLLPQSLSRLHRSVALSSKQRNCNPVGAQNQLTLTKELTRTHLNSRLSFVVDIVTWHDSITFQCFLQFMCLVQLMTHDFWLMTHDYLWLCDYELILWCYVMLMIQDVFCS
jgi:hypothetical protein